jgi:hypothetical protein
MDSHGGRLHSFRHFSNLVWIGIHRMYFTLLQLVLGVQKWFSPACRHATHLACDSLHVQDLLVRLKTLLRERFCQVVCKDRVVALHFVLQHAPQVLVQIELMALDLAKVRLHSLLICQTPKTFSQQCTELFAVWPDRTSCLQKKWTCFLVH